MPTAVHLNNDPVSHPGTVKDRVSVGVVVGRSDPRRGDKVRSQMGRDTVPVLGLPYVRDRGWNRVERFPNGRIFSTSTRTAHDLGSFSISSRTLRSLGEGRDWISRVQSPTLTPLPFPPLQS